MGQIESADSDSESDQRLRAAFQEAAFPPSPQLETAVWRRVQRRRAARFWGWGAATASASLMAAASLFLSQRPPATSYVAGDGTTSGANQPVPIDAAHAGAEQFLAESRALFAEPPVDPFELLSHRQAAMVAVLEQAGSGD